MAESTTRPDFVKEEHLDFLDALRQSGVTNMYGAGRYLDAHFIDLREGKTGFGSSPRAQKILSYWMKTFSERHPR